MTADTYRTSDISRIAYLICRGCRFTTELAADGKRVWFFFDRPRAMQHLLELPNDPPIGANSFLSCFATAKLSIQDARRERKTCRTTSQ